MLIRTRLILIGTLPLLLFLLFVAWTTVVQRQLDLLNEEVVVADNLGKDFFALIVVEQDLLGSKSDRPRQQYLSIMQKIELQLPKVRETFSTSADESELFETLLEHFENSRRDFQELMQWLDLHQEQTLNTVQQGYRARLSKRLHIDLQSAIPIVNQISMLNVGEAAAFTKKSAQIKIAALLLFAVVIILILGSLVRVIIRSVNQLKTGMNQVALGDLESRITVTGQDEFAQFARHFNETISKLAAVTVAREALSAEVIVRKQAEVLLRNSEARLHTIIENLTEGVAVSDLDGQLLHFNRVALDLHGFTTLDECRQHLSKFADTFELSAMDGTLLPLEQWPLARVLRGESLRDLEVYVRHLQAGWKRIYSYGGTLVRNDGQPLMAVVTISDITGRKQAEAKILATQAELQGLLDAAKQSHRATLSMVEDQKRAEVALRNSDAQLRTIIENLTEGVAVSDLDGQLLHFNRAALDLYGFATLDECRQHLSKFADTFELSAMDGTLLALDQWPLARVLRGESLSDLEVHVRHLQAGWQRVYSYGGTLVRDADGQPLMAILTISDITGRKQAEAQLIEQLDELRRWHNATSGREGRILILKHEINELLVQAGQPPRYPSAELSNAE